jgi:hypothetical protein
MPAKLDSFTDTEWITVNGKCKKLKDWTFQSQDYCVRGNCDPDVLLIFEDGTEEYVKNIPELKNC